MATSVGDYYVIKNIHTTKSMCSAWRNCTIYQFTQRERRETIEYWEKSLRADRQEDVSLFGTKLCKIGKFLSYFTEGMQTRLFVFLLSQFPKANSINFVAILPLAWWSLTLLQTAQDPLIPDWTVNQLLVPCLTWVAELFNCSGNTPPFPRSCQQPVRKYHEKRYLTAELRTM